nr:hypothetical protein [uncultured Sphaerochaeta sp.]
MKKTDMMKRFTKETAIGATNTVAIGNELLYFPSEKYVDWLESKAEAYDQLKQSPNLPYEYELFLVYLERNDGDFHKTVRALTTDEKCSLEVMEWFALRLGISWEPEWR